MIESRESDEKRLTAIARAAGERAAAAVDPEATARAVLSRLRERGPQRRKARARILIALASAAVLVLAVATAVRLSVDTASGVPAPVELADLSGSELTEVFDSLAVQSPVHETVGDGLESLSERELAELLELMEG